MAERERGVGKRLHEVSAVEFWELHTSVVGIRRQLRQLQVCFSPLPPVVSLTH